MPTTKYNLGIKKSIHSGMNAVRKEKKKKEGKKKEFSFREKNLNNVKEAMN